MRPRLQEPRTTGVYWFPQEQTRVRHTHHLLVEDPLSIFCYLQAFGKQYWKQVFKVRFHLFSSSISHSLEGVVRWSQMSRKQVSSVSRMGCRLVSCFHPAQQVSLLKGLDCAYRSGEGNSTAEPMHYPSCRLINHGKSFKKKIHVLIFRFCYDEFSELKPHLALAAANQRELLAVMAVGKIQVVSLEGDLEPLCFISAIKPESSLTMSSMIRISHMSCF